MTISSDAHRTGEVGDKLKKVVRLAKDAGYKSIMKFKGGDMIEVGI